MGAVPTLHLLTSSLSPACPVLRGHMDRLFEPPVFNWSRKDETPPPPPPRVLPVDYVTFCPRFNEGLAWSIAAYIHQPEYVQGSFYAEDSWAICRIFKKTSPITPRALSHSWVSPSLPNPNPNPNSSNNHTLNPCISNNNNSPPMQSNSNNANNELVDNSIQSPYPFSLQDLSTFEPIYPTLNNNNPNNKPTILNNNNHPFPNMFNPTILDLPPSYILPQLEDPSDQQSFKSNNDASSMLLIGDFNKSCDANSEFRQNHDYFGLEMLSDHNFNGDNNNYQDYCRSDNLMGDLSNLVHFDDDRGMATLGLFSMEGLLPLDAAEAWKTSSTPLVWDCAPLS